MILDFKYLDRSILSARQNKVASLLSVLLDLIYLLVRIHFWLVPLMLTGMKLVLVFY